MLLEHAHIRRAHRMLPVISELRKCVRSGARMVEVGSLMGESAFGWAASGLFSRIYCVDAWDSSLYTNPQDGGRLAKWDDEKWKEAETTFDQLCGIFPAIRKVKGLSVENAKLIASWDVGIDYLYLDAFHTYEAVTEDIFAWFPLLVDGGIMGGHDCASHIFPGVVRAVSELLGPVTVFPDRSWLAYETRGGGRLRRD